jgi:quinol monooxygenase YgiN
MYVRVTTLRSEGGQAAVRRFGEEIAQALPEVTAQAGCLGGIVVVDPVHGTHQALTFWKSADALVNSQSMAQRITTEIADEMGSLQSQIVVQVLDVIAVDVARLATEAEIERTEVDFPLVDPN